MTENNKLIIELSNLSEGTLRTAKRELKVLIEDYAWKKDDKRLHPSYGGAIR